MKWGKDIILENHWGTKLRILKQSKLFNIANGTVEVWEVEVVESGEPYKIIGHVLLMSENMLIKDGFKSLKKYETKLWKVLNE